MAAEPGKSREDEDSKPAKPPGEVVGDGFPQDEDVSTPPEGSDQDDGE
jgi:hypothetical protein